MREPVSERMLAAVGEALDVEERLRDPMRAAHAGSLSAGDTRRAKILHATRDTIERWIAGTMTEDDAISHIRSVVRAAGDG
jgi:hypothetical protein